MPRHILILVCGLLLALPLAARAQSGTPNQQPDDVTGLGAAISVGYYQTDFAFERSGTYTADVTEVGLALGQHFTRDFSMSFGAGYARANQGSTPAVGGLSPSGYYARIGANYHLSFVRTFGLDFDVDASYHRISASNNYADLVEDWWAYSGAVGPWVRLGPVALEAGLVYRHANGTLDRTGGRPDNESFNFSRSTNPYFELSYHVEPDATIALHLEGGARQGAVLTFGYNFSSL